MSVTQVPIAPLKKGSVAKLWIGVGLLSLAAAGLAWAGTESQIAADPSSFLARNAKEEGVVTTASGLQYKVLQKGGGPRPTMTDMVLAEYEGRLTDGTIFDSSAGKGPATFAVMGVIPGFSEAVQLMQRGTKLRIWLNPELGYGAEEKRDPQTDAVIIPANSVLQFDLTLVDFQPLPPEELEQARMMQMIQEQMKQQGQPKQ